MNSGKLESSVSRGEVRETLWKLTVNTIEKLAAVELLHEQKECQAEVVLNGFWDQLKLSYVMSA